MAAGTAGCRSRRSTPPDKTHIGEQITLFTDRCIMCTRCVRFTREISGTAELEVISRGNHSEIDIFPGEPCNNKLAGNVVDLCPVGALCSKDFLYKQRVWWLKTADSVCPNCSTGAAFTWMSARTMCIGCGRAGIRWRRAASCAMKAGSAGSTFTAKSGLRCRSNVATGKLFRAIGMWCCRMRGEHSSMRRR